MIHEPDLLQQPGMPTGLMDMAYRRLKREIIELRRPPGETFTEPKVAAEFGLSKTPVREALARLHRDGLVRPLPRAGYEVAPVTLGDAAELCDLRILLQSEAAALCATRGLDDATLSRLASLVDDTDAGDLGPLEFEDRLRVNFEFETVIANGSGNRRLAATVARFLDDLERVARLVQHFVTAVSPPTRVGERQAVVDAVVARDPQTARSAMTVRATSAREETLRALSASPSVTSVAIVP